MLTEAEKHGISELLSRMSMEDLQSLAQTVTSKLLVPETSSDAISTIILHTDKAADLLKRRKIKKELLFKYLHFKRVPIESIADKSVHVSRVLELWGSDAGENLPWNILDSDNSLDTPPAPVPSRNASHTSLCSLDLSVSREIMYNRGVELRRSGSSTSIMNCDESSSFSFTDHILPVNNESSSTVIGSTAPSQQHSSLTAVQCQEMANSFVRWYYHLLNTSVDMDTSEWSSSHFWPDASARVSLVSQSGEMQECLEVTNNSEDVSRMLVQVVRNHKLKCNPNLCEEGVRGKLSPHGLVMVLVCGTLHNQHTVCGVFEQMEEEDLITRLSLDSAGSGKSVHIKASGDNQFTFVMDDEGEEDDIEEEEELPAPHLGGSLTMGESEAEASELTPEDETKQRERELTDKYLSGQLSFKDFVQEINNEEKDEEEEMSDEDEEWTPPGKKSKNSKRSRPNSPESSKSKSNRESFEEEFDSSQKAQLKRKKKVGGGGGRRKRLDPALQGLMGEANLRFARGDVETAERMCMEVIRQDPSAPEPFQTLATLYEEQGEIEKSLQFGLLAAHLAPQDGEEWARLADMSLEQGQTGQAADCYRKAIDADPSNARYHFTRAELLEKMGDRKAALRCYKRLLNDLSLEQGEEYMAATKAIATLLHQREELKEATKYFEEAFAKYPDSVNSELVNLFLELLIGCDSMQQALSVCCEWCEVQFSVSDQQAHTDISGLEPEQQLAAFTHLIVPDDLAADIRAKLVVILVSLKAHHLTQEMVEMFLEADTEEFGDLILDMGEAMVKEKLWRKALDLYSKLVKTERYGEAAVWLQLAECQANCNMLEDAEASYKKVVELAPHVYQARLQLSLIIHKLGRAEDALDTLDQDEQQEILNPHLMLERCQMLLAENKIDEFLYKGRILFSRHFVTIRNKDELHAISSAKKMSSKSKALVEVRNFRCEPLTEDSLPEFDSSEIITEDQEFTLFKQMCQILFEQKRFVELQRLTFSALGSPVFSRKAQMVKECEFLCLLSSFYNGDSYHAYNFVRELVIKNVGSNSVWNMFNLVIMRADDVRHNRFLMRLMSRNPDNLALGILNGHNCLVAGTYKYSLGEYMSAFKADSDNPLVALMLGLTFCHMACQKFSAKKHSLVVQASSFLNTYKSLRGDCQEVNYNLGRAMHQLGLLPAALFYYKKGLEQGPSIAASNSDNHNIFDLSREIAFNISLIYSTSGNLQLARYYSEKYISV